MRYLGDLVVGPAASPYCQTLPPEVHAHLVANADQYGDACASQLVAVANRTHVGAAENRSRYLWGGFAGIVVGLAGAWVILARGR